MEQFDIIIIGAGTAGMTAGIYAARANKKTLILEGKNYGGQIINTPDIENFPALNHISGIEYATNLYNQVKELGVTYKREEVQNITEDRVVTTNKNQYQAKAVIIATGTQNRKLGLEGEDNLVGRGISYCATCDGRFYKGKNVAVIGGGNTAIEDAIYLSDLADKVYLIHRREGFRADQKAIEILKSKENVEFILNNKPNKLIAENKLTGLEIINNENEITMIDVSGIFIAIGQIPNTEIFKNFIDLNESGYIKSKDGVHTNIDKIYVAGDVREKELRQLITAASDGAIAANTAITEIQ
ncbi:MAG: thioredoxin-disulfide reductase [Clostridiales bacterium]|jgi:thioredoxin-disulfide reductase|nr:thioredoxin-disulfide reductase [Clostridiales bacterium]